MLAGIDAEQAQQTKSHVLAGQKIAAIKVVRQATGRGLREAKDFVEALEAELRRTSPDEFAAPANGQSFSPAGFVAIAVAVVVAVAVAMMLR